MNFMYKRWIRQPDEIIGCIESSIGKKSFWTGEHFLEFLLAENTAAFHYQLGQFQELLLPRENAYRLKGDFLLHFVFQGPFSLPFEFYNLPIRDGNANCTVALECRIDDNDLEFFRKVCYGRESLSVRELGLELYDSVRSAVASTIKDYTYRELTTGHAQEKKAIFNKLVHDFGKEFVKKGLTLTQIKSLAYENKEKETLEKILQEQEAIQINQRYRELVNAQEMSEAASQAERQKQAEIIAHESVKLRLIKENEIETLLQQLTSEKQEREFSARKLLEKEQLRHRLEMQEIETKHNQNLKEQERKSELDHLQQQLELQLRDIEKKYEIYTNIHKMFESVNMNKAAELESALTRVCYNLEMLPENFAQGLSDTLEQSYGKFQMFIDRIIQERLSGPAWDAIKVLMDSANQIKPFEVKVWTDRKEGSVKSAEVCPGDIFQCSIISNRPGYLFVIDHTTSGKIYHLVPNPRITDNKIEAGKTYFMRNFLPNENPDAEFLFQEDTKPGVERIQALVTQQNVDIKVLFPGIEPVKILYTDEEKDFATISPAVYAEGMRSICIGKKKITSWEELTFSTDFLEFKILEKEKGK